MNNPPAFPGFNNISGYGASKPRTDANGETFWENYEHGMTLRDWFAGMALQGILAFTAEDVTSDISKWQMDNLAEHSYKAADAMLAAREKQSPK